MVDMPTDWCTICEDRSCVLHSHHTVPRSRGGENSLQIPLCPTCHNAIHANALYLVSRIRNPKRKKNSERFWRTPTEEQRAEPFLKILVEALIKPIPEGLEREHLLSVSVSTELFEQFKLLQLDLGGMSQEKLLEYCIQQTIRIRGIGNVKKESQTELWFMQRSDAGSIDTW